MDAVSVDRRGSEPFVASVAWQRPDQSGGHEWVLTVVCKATFDLSPPVMRLSAYQAPIVRAPIVREGRTKTDGAAILFCPSDLDPFKQRVDVTLVGHCFSPQGRTPSVVARLKLGAIDKAIEVFGDRSWKGAELSPPQPFERMSLSYERAAGGPSTSNPAGIPPGGARVPNLQPPGTRQRVPSDRVKPIGFGPVSHEWPQRRVMLRQLASSLDVTDWSGQALPRDIDEAFFNVAPPDQQIAQLDPDQAMLLEHLHPRHPRLETRLPGLVAQAFVERVGRASEPVLMRADGVWIDTDRSLCIVTWRGQVPLVRPDEEGRVYVALVDGRERAATLGPASARGHGGEGLSSTQSLEAVLHETNDLGAEATSEHHRLPDEHPTSTDLFVLGEGTPLPDNAPGWLQRALPERAPKGKAGASRPPPPRAPTPSRPPPLPTAGRVHDERTPPLPPPSIPALEPMDRGLLSADRSSSPDGTVWGGGSAEPSPTAGYVGRPSAPPPLPDEAPAKTAEARAQRREITEMLWFDPACASRLRVRFPKLVDELEFSPVDPARDLATDDPDLARQHHIVSGVLSRARAESAAEVRAAMVAAVGDDGRFSPPLVLCAGTLQLPLSEVELLKATAASMAPLVGADKKLKELLEEVERLVETPLLKGGAQLAENLLRELRSQFSEGKRARPTLHLDASVERVLLENRRFQHRNVFGLTCIRALLAPDGDKSPLVVYIPEEAAPRLPLVLTMRARLLAEAHQSQDQSETSVRALRVLALGRVARIEAW